MEYEALRLKFYISQNIRVGGDDQNFRDKLRGEVYTCPGACRCRSYESVDCSRSGLKTIPNDLTSKVLHLYMEENSVSDIARGCFDTCPNIETLNLRANNLTDRSILEGTLSRLTKLRYLYLADNTLRTIPRSLPSSLVSLSLEGNQITGIDRRTFSHLKKLRNLYLHHNKLTNSNISRSALKDLDSLTEVTMTNNMLTTVPKFPNSIEWAHLIGNQISYIRNGIFRRKGSLLALHLSNNLLVDEGIPEKAFAGLKRLEYLDLSRNKLKSVPKRLPRSLKRLHLEKNEIEFVGKYAFSSLQNLRYLLLQQNMLNSSTFTPEILFPLQNLVTLHIYENKLDRLPDYLPPRLEVLMLMSNNITYLRRETLMKTKRIKELGLQYNKLSNKGLEKGALRSLRRLEFIDMSGNQLTALPTLPSSAQVVILTGNRITRIPRNSMARLTRVRELLMDGNRIERIGDEIFKNSSSLKKLELSDNLLRYLPRFLPPNLEYIGLSNNQLFEIRHDAFYSAPLLQEIFLRENELTSEKVNIKAFRVLRHLKRVEINWRWPG